MNATNQTVNYLLLELNAAAQWQHPNESSTEAAWITKITKKINVM